MSVGLLQDSGISDVNRLRGFVRQGREGTYRLASLMSSWLLRVERAISRSSVLTNSKVLMPLLVSAALLLRLWGVSHLHVWDENVYLLNAEMILTGKAPYNEISSRPPLLSLLFAGGFAIWHSDYSAWAIATTLNAFGALFMYLGGRLFVGRRAAAIAAITLSIAPFLANAFDPKSALSDNTGHSLMTDCPALTVILLAFWLMMRALSNESSTRFFTAGVTMAAAVLMRFGSLSSVVILLTLTLIAQLPVRAFVMCLAGFTAGMLPYLCWSRWRYGSFLATFMDGWYNFDGPAESPFFFIHNAVFTFSWLAILGLLFWCITTLAELWAWRVQPDAARTNTSGGFDATGSPAIPLSFAARQMYLILWAVSLFIAFSSLPHKEPHYILPAVAPLYLLSGVGWCSLFQTPRVLARATAALLLLGAMAGCLFQDRMRFDGPFLRHEENDEIVASSFLRVHSDPSTVLYTASSYPDFAYYARRTTIVLPFNGTAQQEAIAKMPDNSILIAYKRYNDNSLPEPSISSVDVNPNFRRLADFPNIRLYQRVSVQAAH